MRASRRAKRLLIAQAALTAFVPTPMATFFRNVLILKERLLGTGNRNVNRIQRQRKISRLVWRILPPLRCVWWSAVRERELMSRRLLLLVSGYIWLLVLPLPRLGKWTYIDENALQPGQVCGTLLSRHGLIELTNDAGQYILELGKRLQSGPIFGAFGETP